MQKWLLLRHTLYPNKFGWLFLFLFSLIITRTIFEKSGGIPTLTRAGLVFIRKTLSEK